MTPPGSPPLSFEERDLLEHVATLVRELTVTEGRYTLAPQPLPDQSGPVLHDGALVYVNLELGQGDRRTHNHAVRLCGRGQREHARVTRSVQALAHVARRVMRDVQDERLGEPPAFGLAHLDGAMRALLDAPPGKTLTTEACEAVLLAARELRNLIIPAGLDAAVAAVKGWVIERGAIVKLPDFELSAIAVEPRRAGVSVTLRMLIFDAPGGPIRDIKEQQVLLVPGANVGDVPRALACLEGWAAALPLFVMRTQELDTLMPFDFYDDTVIGLKTPRTADEYAGAFARRWKL
jgi:hypothetical protein